MSTAANIRELSAYGNVKIQSEVVWELKRDFVKEPVSRAVRLGECPLEELPVALHSVSILSAIPCRRKLHSHIRLAAQVYPVRREKKENIYIKM